MEEHELLHCSSLIVKLKTSFNTFSTTIEQDLAAEINFFIICFCNYIIPYKYHFI